MQTRHLPYTIPLLLATLTGCSAVAEVAYDIAAQEQRQRCEALISMADRQACRQRVSDAEKQADAQRRQ